MVLTYTSGDIAPRGLPDGVVNVADLLVCLQIVLGMVDATPLELAQGDLYPIGDPDGVINLSDYIILQQLVLNPVQP